MSNKFTSTIANTGYKNIKIVALKERVNLEITLLDKNNKGGKLTKRYNLTSDYLYRDALDAALKLKCKKYNLTIPDEIDYNTGLNYIQNSLDGHDVVKDRNPLPLHEGVIVDVPTSVNMTNIKERGNYYRVTIRPGNGSDETGLNFPFIPGDEYSMGMALEHAMTYRDNMRILSKRSNTGYTNIKVTKVNGVVALVCNMTVDGMPTPLVTKLSDGVSYKLALNISLDFVCDEKDMEKPVSIIYDYGLSVAYALGYGGHNDDPKDVSVRIKQGSVVICPETGERGIVREVLDNVNIAVEFENSKKLRFITNDLLYTNIVSDDIDTIKSLEEKIENSEIPEYDKAGHIRDIDMLEHKIVRSYGHVNGDDGIELDKEVIVKSIKGRANKIFGLKTVPKKPKLLDHKRSSK